MIAIDPIRSITILVHNICKGFNGLSPKNIAPIKAMIEATMFIVSWSTRNFRIALKTRLPHCIAGIIDENLLSKKTISDASLAD